LNIVILPYRCRYRDCALNCIADTVIDGRLFIAYSERYRLRSSLSHFFPFVSLKHSGGMPDDCTVLAIHCVGQDANDTMDQLNK
jgi:hypothetical protein